MVNKDTSLKAAAQSAMVADDEPGAPFPTMASVTASAAGGGGDVKARRQVAPKKVTKAAPAVAKAKPATSKAGKSTAATNTAAKADMATPTDKVGAVLDKTRKPKLVRDSFTMPDQEYAVLGQVKKACLKAGFEIKKSELLRIGVAMISELDLATLQSVRAALPQLKTGRPKKD